MKHPHSSVLRLGTSLLMVIAVNSAQAHGDTTYGAGLPQPGTEVQGAISATWRDEGVLQSGGVWIIPGVLMGGEAYPVEKAASVDEARLSVGHRNENNVFGRLQISSHDNRLEAEVHHAYAGVDLEAGPVVATVTAGRMAAAITPANGEHASDRLFSETPLALDAFLGRQLNDEGVRGALRCAGWQLGVESWRGSAFPATAGEQGGSQDIYLQYQDQTGGVRWYGGVWWLQADALNRSDTRYSAGGHSHSSATNVAPEYEFDGQTDMAGMFVRLNWAWSNTGWLDLEAQWLQASVEGTLRDTTRVAQWEADNNGGWVQGSVAVAAHQFGVRWERLVLDNTLVGAAAADLAQLTHLSNPDHEPERISLIYYWQAQPGFALRFEATEDRLQPESLQRFAVGMVWQGNLFP